VAFNTSSGIGGSTPPRARAANPSQRRRPGVAASAAGRGGPRLLEAYLRLLWRLLLPLPGARLPACSRAATAQNTKSTPLLVGAWRAAFSLVNVSLARMACSPFHPASIRLPARTLKRESGGLVGVRGLEPPTSASRTLRA